MTGPGTLAFCPRCGAGLEERYIEEEERDRLQCPACMFILYINPKPVAGAIPVSDGGIWLLRRAIEPRYGFWTFPAGFIEMGETVEEAAVRETREELGLDLRVGPLLGLYSRSTTPTILAVYHGEALTEPTGGRETLEYRLFRPQSIPWHALAFWSTEAALRDWVRSVQPPG